MLATSVVTKPSGVLGLLAAAALSQLIAPAQAAEAAAADWWTPAANFAKVYDLAGEEEDSSSPTDAVQAIAGHGYEAIPFKAAPLLEFPLSLLGLGTERARENGTERQTAAHNAKKAHQAHQAATMAGATAARVMASSTTGVAAKVKSASIIQVKAAAIVQGQAAAVKVNTTELHSVNSAANSTKAAAAVAKVETKADTKKQMPVITVARKTWMEWVRMTMSFAFIIKGLCMGSNLVFQASPLPVIKEFTVKGHTGEADSAPFISIAYGSCQWCFYGLFAYIVTAKQGFLVLVYSNVCGTFLGMYYTNIFITHCTNVEVWLRSKVYFQVLSVIVASQMIAMLAMPPVKALFFSGLISSAWSVVGAMSMLTTVPTVLRTRSSKSLPQPLLIAALVSALLWITCGVMLRDPWITIPNIACFCCTGFALSLCWIYPPNCGEDEEDEEDTEEVAPLLREGMEEGDYSQVVPDRPSPLINLIRNLRGNEGDGTPTATRYGSMKGSSSCHGISAGTGETWD